MSNSINEIWLAGERLDLDDETQLLPSFQANDRTRPSTIQSDYSPEFSVPATSKNHRLLEHAAASQAEGNRPYVRVPAMLTSGGVETLPLALLHINGYEQGRYNLQIFGGNRRLVEALGDKKLSDLDFSRFDHDWTPATIAVTMDYDHWKQTGWGYEVYDRGKPIDLTNIDPYTLYPSCSADLVFNQILVDAGFTGDSLLSEPLFATLNVPSANPYTFSQKYRDDRRLKAGFQHTGSWFRDDEFQELAPINFVGRKPWVRGSLVPTGPVNQYVVTTLGLYDLSISLATYFGCNERLFGEVSMKVVLRKNGAPLLNDDGTQVEHSERFKGYKNVTLAVSKKRILLQPGDVIDVQVQGDKWPDGAFDPDQPQWYIGTRVVRFPGTNFPPDFSGVEPACSFSVELNEEFPPGGRVHLNEWLPDMKQLDFVKTVMLLLGLTIQVDQYTPHLRLAAGSKLLANLSKAKNWTNKRDAAAVPGRLPERRLAYRFGDYGQLNHLLWTEDEHVTLTYGDGQIPVADQLLAAEYEMATLPFAATEASNQVPGLLCILNFDTEDETATPVEYSKVEAKPRLTLRPDGPIFYGQLIMQPATLTSHPVMASYTSTASYFDGVDLSLELDRTVLTQYWADLRAMLDKSRYLTEQYRLTAQDIAELDFSIPIWDAGLGDYFVVSKISEFDPRRSTEVELVRINSSHLPAPTLPGGMREFYNEEWYSGEWY